MVKKKGAHMKTRIEMNKVKAVVFLLLLVGAFSINAVNSLQKNTPHSAMTLSK